MDRASKVGEGAAGPAGSSEPEWSQRSGRSLTAARATLGRLLAVAVVAPLVAGGALFLAPLLRVYQPVVPVLDTAGQPTAVAEQPVPVQQLDFFTVLVVGLDDDFRRSGRAPEPGQTFADIPLAELRGRSDSIMLLGFDRRSDAVRLLHVPRDAIVAVPGRGEDKVGHFTAYHSFFELKKALENLLLVPVHRYVAIDLAGFKEMVDAIGGVTVVVDHDLLAPDGVWLPRGRHRLDGAGALRFARHRYGEAEADLARVRLQYTLLTSLARELAAGGLPKALAAYRESPRLLKTDLSWSDIMTLTQEWSEHDPSDVVHLYLPGSPEGHSWRVDPVEMRQTLEEFWPDQAPFAPPPDELFGPEPGDATHSGTPGQPPASGRGDALAQTKARGPAGLPPGPAGMVLRLLAGLCGLDERDLWTPVYRPFLRAGPTRAAPPVLIYHTHATESFLPEIIPDPVEREEHNPNREAFSADLNLTVVRVGRELAAGLADLGFEVHHNEQVHDWGGWMGRTGAYARSRVTAAKALRTLGHPVLVLDVHRDAVTTRTTVAGRPAASVLFVVARQNPWWQWNYTVARQLQARLAAVDPGLVRGVHILDGRYNQDLSPLALIVEVGGAGSSLEECLTSARILAGVIADWTQGR